MRYSIGNVCYRYHIENLTVGGDSARPPVVPKRSEIYLKKGSLH